MIPADINGSAVAAAALANMVLGFLWYSPLLLGRRWMAAMNWGPQELEKAKQKGMGKTYFLTLLTALAMASVLALILAGLQIEDWYIGLLAAFLLWIGFVLPATSGSVLFEGRRPALFWITAGYYLVSLIIMSEILVLWP